MNSAENHMEYKETYTRGMWGISASRITDILDWAKADIHIHQG
jgi:hypothetical protein